jgi:hypothetical protein
VNTKNKIEFKKKQGAQGAADQSRTRTNGNGLAA